MTELQMLRAQFEQTGKLISAMEAKNKLPKIDFSVIVKAKQARLGKFGAVIKADQAKQSGDALKSNGWHLMRSNPNESFYGLKSKPGMQLKISAGRFSVMQHAEEHFPKTDLSFLDAFLKAK